MGYTWILDLVILIAEACFWRKERKVCDETQKPLPKIVGSVPHVPLKK